MFFRESSAGILSLFVCSVCMAAANLTVAIPNKVKYLDPRKSSIAHERYMLPLIFEGLFLTSEEGQIQNQIAKSWNFDKKTREFKVTINDNRRFSDGSKLSASDVVYSFSEYCRANELTSKILEISGVCETPVRIDSKDASIVIFKIKDSPNDFLFRIGNGRYSIFRISDNKKTVGSGQFKIALHEETHVRLEPNPFYYSTKQTRTFDFIFVTEEQLQQRLNDKSIDVATLYLNSTIEILDLKSYKLISYSPVVTQTLVVNENRSPFNSSKFRTAFYDSVTGNPGFLKCKKGSVLANGLIPYGVGGSIANDVDRKKKLEIRNQKLKKREYVTFVRHINRKDSCEESVIAGAGDSLNLGVKFKYIDDYDILMKMYADKSADGIVELYVFGRDPSLLLSRLIPGTPQPIFYYTDKKIAELLEKASKEDLLRTRFQYFREAAETIKKKAVAVPLYYESHTNILKACLFESKGELKPNPNSFLFLLALPETTNCADENSK